MKTKYSVDFGGRTFTRTSERVYTHVIVGRWNLAREIDCATSETMRAIHRSRHAYLVGESVSNAYSNAYGRENFLKSTYLTAESFAAAVAMTADEYVEQKVAKNLEGLEAQRVAGHFACYRAISWAGRPDLARKAVASQGAAWVDVQAVPVVQPAMKKTA